MIEPDASVTLGGLLLLDHGEAAPSDAGYTLSVMGEDTTFGNPQPVTTTLYSMLRNGSIVTRERDENRQPVLLVEVEAALNDGNALARGEAAIMAVCGRPVELVWTPPQAGAEPAVFDVVESSVEHQMDDIDELNLRRTFRITLNALPHSRRDDETVVAALAPPPVSATTVSVDTCDSASGWGASGGDGKLPTAVGGYLVYGASNAIGFSELVMSRQTGLVDFTPTQYLLVEWQGFAFQGSVGPLTLDGQSKVAEQALGDGWTKTTFRVVGDQSVLTFRAVAYSVATGSRSLRIRDLTRTDQPPIVGTGRESFRTLTVGGTVTTQGSIDVVASDGATDLGDVIVFTFPSGRGAQPHLSPWQTLPAVRTTDTSTVSGGRNFIIADPCEWLIPASNLPPGEYAFVARLRDTTTAGNKDIVFSTRSRMSGVNVGPDIVGTVTVPLSVVNQWYIVTLATLNLPATPIGSGGVVRIALTGGTGATNTQIDEAWVFSTDGKLTMLNGVTEPRVSIRAPSLTEDSGSLWIGTAADGSDWFGAGSLSTSRAAGGHDLEPGENNLFVVSTGLPNPAVSSRHYDRFHTHPVAAGS